MSDEAARGTVSPHNNANPAALAAITVGAGTFSRMADILKPAEAARLLAVSMKTLQRLRELPVRPLRCLRYTDKVFRYRRSDVEQFIKDRTR